VDSRFEFYAITDQNSAQGRSDLEIAAGLIEGGVSCLQYRAKKAPAREQWETAFQLRALCRKAGIPFIVNDRVDLALDCEADGVHLGQDDTPLEAARRLAGNRLFIGRSTHSLEQALKAAAEGADYIGYGPLYATGTKENNVPPVGPASLGAVIKAVRIPVVAIGGLKLDRLAEVAAQGAEHVAVVTALTGAAEVARTAKAYVEGWRGAKRHFQSR
jgi:thiamine-phosphate pyrophosphorylase